MKIKNVANHNQVKETIVFLPSIFRCFQTLVLGRNHPPYNWVGKVSSPTTHKKESQLRLQAKGGS